MLGPVFKLSLDAPDYFSGEFLFASGIRSIKTDEG
jgi:hypothetical protein